MKLKTYFLSLIFVLGGNLTASSPFQEKQSLLIQKMSEHLDRMRHEINNHDAELRILESKLLNIEDAVENLRSLIDEALQSKKEKTRDKEFFDSKLLTHDTFQKNVIHDIKNLQISIEEIQKSFISQNSEIDILKKTLKSLMSAFSLNENITKDESTKTYKVQPGDSLGLIAQKHGIKIKDLKEINKLKNDVIFQGQILKIPN